MHQDDDHIALSDLQLDVMRVLWRGEAGVGDVTDALAPTRALAYTTVATVLSRLHRRGAVTQRREGRQLLYSAAVSEAQVRRSMVSGLLQSLFRGDPKALLAHLVGERELRDGDLEQVRDLLARDADAKRRPRR